MTALPENSFTELLPVKQSLDSHGLVCSIQAFGKNLKLMTSFGCVSRLGSHISYVLPVQHISATFCISLSGWH